MLEHIPQEQYQHGATYSVWQSMKDDVSAENVTNIGNIWNLFQYIERFTISGIDSLENVFRGELIMIYT